MRPRSRRVRGTTLLELLVVLALLGALLGVGVGLASRLSFGRQSGLESVKGALQSARAFAVAQGTLARVLAVKEERTIHGVGFRTIGQWHFEGDGAEGALGLKLDLHAAGPVEDGKVGSALAFADAGYAEAAIGSLPSWTGRDGLAFEADVRVDRGGGTVARRGDAWRIEVRADGSVGAEVTLVSATKGEGARGERLRVETGPDAIRHGRWSRVGFLYDRTCLRLTVDGAERARSARATEALWSDAAPLRFSDPERTLQGAIDEAAVSTLLLDEPRVLPEGVELVADAEIWFDASGNLDPTRHAGPAFVELVFGESDVRRVEVGAYGTLR